jgi:hypothetical protein
MGRRAAAMEVLLCMLQHGKTGGWQGGGGKDMRLRFPALGVKVMSHVFGWSHSVSHASLEKNDSKMTPENRKFRMVTLHEKRSWPSLVLHSFPVHG